MLGIRRTDDSATVDRLWPQALDQVNGMRNEEGQNSYQDGEYGFLNSHSSGIICPLHPTVNRVKGSHQPSPAKEESTCAKDYYNSASFFFRFW